jgi:plasmid stabilization system protein ParE
MRFRVAFAPRAEADLKGFFDHVRSRSGEARARDTIAKLHAHCLGFDRFPERGVRRDAIRHGLRIVGFKRQATIAFTVRGRDVVILRVIYGGRNVDAVLAEGE